MKIILPAIFCFISVFAFAQSNDHIKVYFNNPVDTTVATGKVATYLHNTVDDTLIAYIGRAKYSIDVAVYNFGQSGQISSISGAIDSAYAKGIRVRWIYDGGSSNSGLSQLIAGIHKLGSPTTADYGIMHDKFMVIDAASPDSNDAIVWTGSCNWNAGQVNSDVNNIIIIQDQTLAHVYTQEFNEMWGDTGLVPNLNTSRFGSFKSDNTQHSFMVDGKLIECYFSPSDNTNDYILNSINSANSQLFFGLYTFTLAEDANAIKSKIQNDHVYAAGIIDQFSQGYSPYSILHPVMGSMLKVYAQSNTLYHNKLLIVDPCDYNSDPLVETGSHNWSFSANTINDENTLIVHDSTTANLYYQSFKKNFANVAGTLATCALTGINDVDFSTVTVFPNPATGFIRIEGLDGLMLDADITDVTGKNIFSGKIFGSEATTIPLTDIESGVYFIAFRTGNKSYHSKFILQN